MEKHSIYLLVVKAGSVRIVLKSTMDVKVGDVVQYVVDGAQFLAEVSAVLQTHEGSDICRWIEEACSHLGSRSVIAVWKRE